MVPVITADAKSPTNDFKLTAGMRDLAAALGGAKAVLFAHNSRFNSWLLLVRGRCKATSAARATVVTPMTGNSQHIQKKCPHKVVHPPHDAFGLDMTSPRIE